MYKPINEQSKDLIGEQDMLSRSALDAALRAYAEQPQFRSATGDEVIFDNPFHRPVRAQDLSFLDFSRPVDQDHVHALCSLMGNRMLFNIYEADLSFVGESLSQQAHTDRAAFYSTANRVLGERVRGALERHCFAWIDDALHDTDEEPASLIERSLAEFENSASAVAHTIEGSASSTRMAQLLAIQICGPLRARDFARQRYVVAGLDGHWNEWIATAAGVVPAWRRAYPALANAAQLSTTPHAYWQFYLGSQLAVANYLARTLRAPSRFFEAAGAIVADRLCSLQLARCWCEVFVSAFGSDMFWSSDEQGGGSDALCSEALKLLEKAPGAEQAECLNAFKRGLQGMCRVWVAANEDLGRQIAWAGHPAEHRALAEDYMRIIRDRALAVAMETYVEPSSERSTTHVHDTDRLLVIESGEMDFWHSYGQPLHFEPGDMIFVPKHRLHGSVVTTDQCVYHQPIVDAKLRELVDRLRSTH
jgi:mannose-6-phosphate isomerase-like protein (cupin superfamily)